MWDNIYQPYQTGSEGGLIIADEEYRDSCRITLENVKDIMLLHVEFMEE